MQIFKVICMRKDRGATSCENLLSEVCGFFPGRYRYSSSRVGNKRWHTEWVTEESEWIESGWIKFAMMQLSAEVDRIDSSTITDNMLILLIMKCLLNITDADEVVRRNNLMITDNCTVVER